LTRKVLPAGGLEEGAHDHASADASRKTLQTAAFPKFPVEWKIDRGKIAVLGFSEDLAAILSAIETRLQGG
jgi:hypothetical protein